MSDAKHTQGSGNRLMVLREKLGMTQTALNRQLGWPRGRLSRYESDSRSLSLPVIEEIAGALGLEPAVAVLFVLAGRYPALMSVRTITCFRKLEGGPKQ